MAPGLDYASIFKILIAFFNVDSFHQIATMVAMFSTVKEKQMTMSNQNGIKFRNLKFLTETLRRGSDFYCRTHEW